MSDVYGALAPVQDEDTAASADPYAALIPKGKAQTAAPTPSDTSNPYEALVPKVPASAGGYPTANNQLDPLAHPEMPGILNALAQGVMSGYYGVKSTVEGGAPPVETSPAAQPFEAGDIFHPIARGLPKAAYQVGQGSPTIAGGMIGGTAAGLAAPEFSPLSELVGGGVGASIGNTLQSLGPALADELRQTPNDAEGAWERAKIKTGIGAAGAGLGWGLFGAKLLEGPVKNALFQAVSVQPLVAAGTQVGQNVAAGKPALEGASQASLNAMVMTAPIALGHAGVNAAVSRYGGGRAAPPPSSQQVNDVLNGMSGPAEPEPPPSQVSGPRGEPPPSTPPAAPPAPMTGGYDELNPPPPGEADIPPSNKISGTVNDDMGFGLRIRRGSLNTPYELVNDEGTVLASGQHYDEMLVAATRYLDTGSVGDLQGPDKTPVNPTTDLDPEVSQFLAKKAPKLSAGEGEAPQLPVAPTVVPLPTEPPPLNKGARFDLPGGRSIRAFQFDNEPDWNWGVFGSDGKLETGFSSWAMAKADAEADNPNIAKEELQSKPGVNTARMAKLLGPKLYGTPKDLPAVTVKELFQNGFDAIKSVMEKGQTDKGIMRIATDANARTITFFDNGSGMTPEVLGKQFLEIAGTHKESERASGGLGIAKMLTLFGNKGLRVVTMRDGKVSRMATSGDDLFAALEDPSRAPKIHYGEPTPQERALFPEGRGTAISITVPKEYVDPETGDKQRIYFPTTAQEFPVLRNSPLLGNIHVTFNDRPVSNMGANFPVDDYTNLFNVKFNWGDARIYVGKKPFATSGTLYADNMHVLSNGLWQFSGGIKKDPSQAYGENVNHQFYVDLNPKAKPEDPGYPFDLNRQRFAPAADRDISKVLHYISLLYKHEDLRNSATNFGEMYYLDAPQGKLVKSGPVKIEPKKPTDNPITLIQPGDKVSVVDGVIKVNGREVPTLDPKDIKAMSPNVDELRVDQKEIDPNRVMVHDNTLVKMSETEQKSIVQLAQEKFGLRFEQFMHDVGGAFKDLRDVVAKDPIWKGLADEAIGVSFDKEYRGVSIRLPFSGSFINPAIPEYSDPLRAAVGMVGTMVHELAHHNVRSHNADFPAEMQRIIIYLDTHKGFDFHAFKQKVVNAVASNKDIFGYINDFYSGAYDLQSRGKRFKDSGANEARNGSAPESVEPVGSGGGSSARVSGPVGDGADHSAKSIFGQGTGRRVTESGSSGPLAEQRRNTAALRQVDGGLTAEFPQPELGPLKDGIGVASGTGGSDPGVVQLGAHADRMNKMYKWLWGLDRLVDRNPRFTPLLRYAERIREMRLDTSKIHDAGLRIAKQWRKLGNRAEPLAALIDDVANMNYRTPAEAAKGVRRMPTEPEFDALVKKHGVDADALSVFDKQRKFFSIFLDLVTQNATDTALRVIQDPVALAARLDQIRAQKENLNKAPYFPFTRFGSHFLTVRDAAGNVTFFETYERRGAISAERIQQRAKADLQRTLPAGSTITEGVLPETAAPFVGMPPELLESISKELNLTKDQMDALDQIRYQFAPSASFVHHFQQKSYTPGYSSDFLRAFSRYAFHGARYYSRTKYAWALRDEIKAARATGGNKAGAIANYMEDHLQNAVLDAKGDFGLFKGAIFLWVFGYSPAGALINLSQVPMISYPFMAAKFGGIGIGDARATAALVKAMGTISNFYKRGSYDAATEFENRALDYGIKSGRISEAMASELAGLAQGQNLFGFGKSKVAQGFQTFMEKAASMFELAEQFNRRVTYRAALDLAMAHPDAAMVKEALNKHADEFVQLQAKGFNKAQAAAIVTAAYTTEETQFVYARETRPRAFRGKLAGTLLVFKTYMLNVLQLMGANKSSVMPRFMLMMLGLAGVYGLPGSEDITDIVQALGKWYFGKDFNVKLALRQLILDVGHGVVPPDLVLHGLGRKSFGIPALMDMMGEHPGRGLGGAPDTPETRANYAKYAMEMRLKGTIPGSYEEFQKQHSQNTPAPQVDMSNSLGMGRLLPFDLGKVLDPGNDPNTAIAGTAQQASGAVFSVGFNLYKALQDDKTPATDWKRWERTLPRAVASASRAYRAYDEGRERGKGGPAGAATITNYNARDPEQMMEIAAMAAGFMPSRQSAQWDSISAQAEVQAKFKFEKQLLMTQMYEATIGKVAGEQDRVKAAIIDYNKNLPDWAKGEQITGKALKESIEGRYKDKLYREAGVPRQKTSIPVARHIQGLFPESVVDVRKLPQ